MFVMSKRNILIPSPDGTESVRLQRGEVAAVPEWASKTAYFKALLEDGKLLAADGAEEKGRKRRGRRGAETQDETGQEVREESEQEVREESEQEAQDGPGQEDPGGE